jgi:two-component system NarL family sensor kinase
MNDFEILIIISVFVFLLLAVFIFVFMVLFQRKQQNYIIEKTALKARYEQEILQSQVEIQNQTLQNIGRELHDNIGQLLTVVKLNLGMMNTLIEEKNLEETSGNTEQIHQLIDQVIGEIRSLSKSLDGNFVQEFGLQQSVFYELQRIKKTKKFNTELQVEGKPYKLDFQREIILFRVVQEVLNNALKHSKASEITLVLNYQPQSLTLIIQDNGIGFDTNKAFKPSEINESGIGLRNIQKRINLIAGECKIQSSNGLGTIFRISIPKTP